MALRIGVGLSRESNPYFAGKNASLKALNSLGVDIPELGLAFSYYDYPIYQVYDGIKSSLGEKNLVVINSLENIVGRTSKKRSVALALFSGHSFQYAVSLVKNVSENPYLAGHHLAWGMLDILGNKTGGREILRKIALIFVSDSFHNKEVLLKGLQEVLGLRFPIVGGVISTENSLQPGTLIFNREGNSDSVAGILIGGENLVVGLGCFHGWIPLGLADKIKKIESNRIQELKNMSPFKYYTKYLGEYINLAREDIHATSTIYPLGIEIKKDTYSLRFPRRFEPGGSIIVDSQLSENQVLRLMMGTREELLEASRRAVNSALKPLEEERVTPQLILVISAIERKEVLGLDIYQEIDLIKRKVPETTRIIGLYTYGQFAPLGNIKEMAPSLYQNGTIATIALGIKKG